MDFTKYLKSEIEKEMNTWVEKDIYAISFLLNWAEDDETSNSLPSFSLMRNTESACDTKDPYGEERWNVAFWEIEEKTLISPEPSDKGCQLATEWLHAQGIVDVGAPENEEQCYDEDMNYIGKGPAGAYELMMLLAEIAHDLQTDGFIRHHFGNVPILVHDYEYIWCSKDATLRANPDGQAQSFFKAMQDLYN